MGKRDEGRSDMNETDEKAIEQMKLALASCAGPVTRCPPGRARAPAEAAVVRSASVQRLRKNQDARPIRDTKAARRQMRVARAQQQRVGKCNAPLLKRINKQERNARARENERVAARYSFKARQCEDPEAAEARKRSNGPDHEGRPPRISEVGR